MIRLHTIRFKALGGHNEVQIFSDDAALVRRAADAVVSETRRIEQHLSRFNSNSAVSRIGSCAGVAPVKVDEEVAKLLRFADACYHDSDGLFDITSAPLSRAWNFQSEGVPRPQDLAGALDLVGWHLVEWRDPYIFLPRPGMSIDLGGLGKEYAVDRVTAILEEMKVLAALVNFAGDVAVVGSRPDRRPWLVGITNPRGPTPIGGVAVGAGALATSGDYERFKIVDGKRYCHIINPKTGVPVCGVQSVSIVAESCLMAGAIATITMLRGASDGVKFLKMHNVPFFMVADEGMMAHRWSDATLERASDGNMLGMERNSELSRIAGG